MCDQRLIEDLKKKRDDYAERVWKEFHPKVLNAIKAKIRNAQDAEELASTIFLKVFQIPTKVTTCTELEAYLMTAAKNAAIDYHRRKIKIIQKQQDPRFQEYAGQEEEGYDVDQDDHQAKRLKEMIDNIGTLPVQRRRVMEMHHIEGIKPQEIASRLGLARQSVYNHLRLGLKQLLQKYPDLPMRKDTLIVLITTLIAAAWQNR